MASLPTLSEGIALTHFIVAEDVERAGRFYSDVLGGEIVLAGVTCSPETGPSHVRLPTPERAGGESHEEDQAHARADHPQAA